jgi:SAM-dependent methyltransferase
LVEYNIGAEKIANFGCNIGGETLALMWVLGASEAIGLDIDEDEIRQARGTLASVQEEMRRIWWMLSYYPNKIAHDDKTWWNNEVPDFLKKAMLQEESTVTYVVSDITQPTGLPQDYYDVAFCDFVLHHIWYDDKRENAEGDTQFAVKEMARVVKPGGIVAVSELLQYSDKPKLDFGKLFEKAGLRIFHMRESEVNSPKGHGTVAEYICKKPDAVRE